MCVVIFLCVVYVLYVTVSGLFRSVIYYAVYVVVVCGVRILVMWCVFGVLVFLFGCFYVVIYV